MGGGQQPSTQSQTTTQEPWSPLIPYLLSNLDRGANLSRGRIPGFSMPDLYIPQTGQRLQFPTGQMASAMGQGQGANGWPALGTLAPSVKNAQGNWSKPTGKPDMQEFLKNYLGQANVLSQIRPGAFAMPVSPNAYMVAGAMPGLKESDLWGKS